MSLASLIEKTLAGDINAYETVIKRFQAMAAGYAYAILKDNDLVSDVCQEAFIEAYYNLAKLQNPEAFPGWLKRIIFKQCDRLTRAAKENILPDETQSEQIACTEDLPDKILEKKEINDLVWLSADTLSSEQRTVLLLFYIKDYSLNDIASFLEISASAVKKRLFDARKNLKERMTKMVKDKIAAIEPKEIFSHEIIKELLKRPDLLKIPSNPVAQVLEIIKKALSDYEFVDSSESISQSVVNQLGDNPNTYYHLENNDLLRTSTTLSLIPIIKEKHLPCRIMLAGRVFRDDKESSTTSKVFYQVEITVIEEKLNNKEMIDQVYEVIEAILGKCRIYPAKDRYVGFTDVEEYFIDDQNGNRFGVGGGGMFENKVLEKLGIDSTKYQGYSCGFGLDRLAMAKFGLNSIQELYKPEYLEI